MAFYVLKLPCKVDNPESRGDTETTSLPEKFRLLPPT